MGSVSASFRMRRSEVEHVDVEFERAGSTVTEVARTNPGIIEQHSPKKSQSSFAASERSRLASSNYFDFQMSLDEELESRRNTKLSESYADTTPRNELSRLRAKQVMKSRSNVANTIPTCTEDCDVDCSIF